MIVIVSPKIPRYPFFQRHLFLYKSQQHREINDGGKLEITLLLTNCRLVSVTRLFAFTSRLSTLNFRIVSRISSAFRLLSLRCVSVGGLQSLYTGDGSGSVSSWHAWLGGRPD